MYTRKEVISAPEYWFTDAQMELFRQVIEYLEREKMSQTELAAKLGVTKGYISQILKGDFNYTLKKLIEISLAIGMIPRVTYEPIEKFIQKENKRAQRSKRRTAVVAEPRRKYGKR